MFFLTLFRCIIPTTPKAVMQWLTAFTQRFNVFCSFHPIITFTSYFEENVFCCIGSISVQKYAKVQNLWLCNQVEVTCKGTHQVLHRLYVKMKQRASLWLNLSYKGNTFVIQKDNKEHTGITAPCSFRSHVSPNWVFLLCQRNKVKGNCDSSVRALHVLMECSVKNSIFFSRHLLCDFVDCMKIFRQFWTRFCCFWSTILCHPFSKQDLLQDDASEHGEKLLEGQSLEGWSYFA